MEFCRKQHFLELDILLQKIEPNIDKRRFKIKNILQYAYRMQHNDAEKSPFVPASESLWRRFYKCPKKFLHNPEYIVNASVVYVPKIRVLARGTVNLQLNDGNFKQMRQSLEDERNLQETLFQIINFLGDTMPLEATSFRGFLARTAEVLKKGERSPADEEKIVALIVKYFRLETLESSKNSFGFYFREICNITGLNEDKNFLIQAGSKKKNFIVPNKFIYIDDNKAVFVMYGMVVHKSEPHSEYQFLRMKYDSRSLGKLNSLQSAREIIGKKIFSISKGTSEIASSKAIATIKFIIYNRVIINVSEVKIGLGCSGYLQQNFEANSQQIKKPEHIVLETLDPKKDEWKTLSRLSGIDDGQQLKEFFTKRIKDVVLRFYLATNGALGEMQRKFIKKFETEQILFANRRDPILRYMMQKKQNIVVNVPKAPPKVDELTEVPEQKQQFSDAEKASLRNAGVDDTTISYIENSIYMFWPIIYIFFIFLENYFPQLKGKRLSLTTITTLVCTLLVKIYSKIESGKSFTDLIFDLVKEFIPDSVWQQIALGAFGAAGLFYLARTNSAAVLEWFSTMVAYLKGTTFTYEHWKQTGDDLFKIVECAGQDSDFAPVATIVKKPGPNEAEGESPGKPVAKPGVVPVVPAVPESVPGAAVPGGAVPGVVTAPVVTATPVPVPVSVTEAVPLTGDVPVDATATMTGAESVAGAGAVAEAEKKTEEAKKDFEKILKEKEKKPEKQEEISKSLVNLYPKHEEIINKNLKKAAEELRKAEAEAEERATANNAAEKLKKAEEEEEATRQAAEQAAEQQNQRKIKEDFIKLDQSQILSEKYNNELKNRIKADERAEEARKKQDFENFLESARKEAEKTNEKNFTEFRNNLEANKKAKEANKEAENLKDFEEILKSEKLRQEAEKLEDFENLLKKRKLRQAKEKETLRQEKEKETLRQEKEAADELRQYKETELKNLKEEFKIPTNIELSNDSVLYKKLKYFLDKGTPEQKLKYFNSLGEWSSSENDLSRLVDISQGKVFDSLEPTDLLDYFEPTKLENWETEQLKNIKPEKVAEKSKIVNNILNNLNNEAKEDFLTNLNNAESTKLKDPLEYLNNLITKNKDNKEKLINENYIPPENKIQIRPKIIEKLTNFLNTGTREQKLNYFKRLDEWSSSENDLSRLVDISRGTPSIQDYLRTTNIENWEKNLLKTNDPEKVAETSKEIDKQLNSLPTKKKDEFKKLLNENTGEKPVEYLKNLIDEESTKNNAFNDFKKKNFVPEKWNFNESLLNKLNELKTENEKNIYLQFYNNFKESPESLKNLADIAKKDYWKSYNNNNNIDISEILKINEISPEIKNSINNKIAYNGYKTSKYLPETWDYSESLLNKLNELDTSEKKEIYLNFLKEDNTWNKSPETISRLVDISSNNVWKKWELTDIYDQYHYGSIEKKTSPETVANEVANKIVNGSNAKKEIDVKQKYVKNLIYLHNQNRKNENDEDRTRRNIEMLEKIEEINKDTIEKYGNEIKQGQIASNTIIGPQISENNLITQPENFYISDDNDNDNENNNNAIIPENNNNFEFTKYNIDLLKKTVNEFKNAKQTGNETLIKKIKKELEKLNENAEEKIDYYFSFLNDFFDYLASFFTFENLQDFGSHVATRTTNLATETATKLALNYIQNSITGFNIPITTSAIVTAAATTAFNTALDYLFSGKPLEYNVDWPIESTALSDAPRGAVSRSAAPTSAVSRSAPPAEIRRSDRIASKKGLPRYFRYAGRGVPSLTVDTQELIPQDLNPIRLALEALLCFMIWFGSKKCDSIKGFLITVLVAILLLFALMAITMGIVTGRNCGVGGKDLLQRIVYYAFVSIGYYFTDLFSGGAGDIFAKFATKTATFGALYFLFESVTAVSEKKKPLKEEAKKLLKNLKKEKK